MAIEKIETTQAPAAIGPYSQAIKSGNLLFCSGQIPLDPETGELIAGDVRAQTEQAMKNLEQVLAAAGAGFSDVVKTTIYLADMNDFAVVNEVYGGHFSITAPARATVQVAALPKGAQVEIDAIACLE
ncbi:MAG: reactive intermediate/imine deaminase [Desulfuromonas sp.]|nr:MAG: reactive intermediate/imine deaminase [Desulfuromonas sp.]